MPSEAEWRDKFEKLIDFEYKEYARLKNEVTAAMFRSHRRRLNLFTELLGERISERDANLAQEPKTRAANEKADGGNDV